jgi:multiple sugar transport system substrate-binding protein
MNREETMLVRNTGRHITRRKLLAHSALAGAVMAIPSILASSRPAGAQSLSASAFAKANIDWKQVKGEEITVAVIPAGYFNNLIDVAGSFEELSGIKVNFDKIPPGQIRQKVMLDLSSKTGVYATHAADPMYYPLYIANKWSSRSTLI